MDFLLLVGTSGFSGTQRDAVGEDGTQRDAVGTTSQRDAEAAGGSPGIQNDVVSTESNWFPKGCCGCRRYPKGC